MRTRAERSELDECNRVRATCSLQFSGFSRLKIEESNALVLLLGLLQLCLSAPHAGFLTNISLFYLFLKLDYCEAF